MNLRWLVPFLFPLAVGAANDGPLLGTRPLEVADQSELMVDGIHRFLDRQLAGSPRDRAKHWQPDFSSADAHEKSIANNRQRFVK